MAKAQMSIGQPINEIPGVKRKREQKTRLDAVLKALKKVEPGKVLPIYIYTGSKFAAANLALLLRKAPQTKNAKVVTRKHIVYVQHPIKSALQQENHDSEDKLELRLNLG